MSPLGGDHHVVVGLVPEVISVLSLVLLAGGVRPHRLERLSVQQDEAPLAVLARPVSEGGDHDVAVRQTVSRVGSAHSLGMHLPRLDHLVQSGVARISLHVHDVDPVGPEAGHDEPGPGGAGVVVAGAAGVPAGVVELVTNVGHVEPGDDLGVGGTVGIDVNSGHIVRPVLGGNQAGKIDDLLASSRLKGMSRNEWKKYKSVF